MSSPRLNQPWRAAVAGGLVVVAVLAVLAAVWSWQHGIVRYDIPAGEGTPEMVSTRFVGSWLSGAVGLGTLAAILLVSAARQLLLALRTRDSHPLPPVQTAEPPPTNETPAIETPTV
ncbi:MAG TPA: hypothetical protein VGD48_22895 [Kutzneria sp.]|jgi:Na+/proline symporter